VEERVTRPFSGGLTVAGGLCALVVGLALVDERVRVRLADLATGRTTSGELASVSAKLQQLAEVVAEAVRDQSIEQAPLVIFGLAAIVLVLFMLRT
jgi:hypothetical protein